MGMMGAITSVRALAVLASVGAATAAAAAEIRVYSSGAPSVAAKAIADSFAAQGGHHFRFTVGQPATIESDLAAGGQADVVILPTPAIALLNQSGVLRAGSAVDLARVGIGVVIRNGGRRPEIGNAAAIRQLLIDARSVVYPDPRSGGGSAGRAIAHMIEQMGVSDIVKPKLILVSAIGGGVDLVAGGKAEVGFFNISEILPIKGVTLIGPLPAELQSYIVFDAAIPTRNAAPEPAVAYIHALAAPAASASWAKAGLEPLGSKP